MNVIFFSQRLGRTRHFDLARPLPIALLVSLALGLIAGSFAIGLSLGEHSMARRAMTDPVVALKTDQAQIAQLRATLQDKIDALAMRLGLMDAHLIRLNALGKQLTEMANINSREFDFDHDPPLGGPEESLKEAASATAPGLSAMIDELSRRIDLRDAQLSAPARKAFTRVWTSRRAWAPMCLRSPRALSPGLGPAPATATWSRLRTARAT
jgi:hypothetical protein